MCVAPSSVRAANLGVLGRDSRQRYASTHWGTLHTVKSCSSPAATVATTSLQLAHPPEYSAARQRTSSADVSDHDPRKAIDYIRSAPQP